MTISQPIRSVLLAALIVAFVEPITLAQTTTVQVREVEYIRTENAPYNGCRIVYAYLPCNGLRVSGATGCNNDLDCHDNCICTVGQNEYSTGWTDNCVSPPIFKTRVTRFDVVSCQRVDSDSDGYYAIFDGGDDCDDSDPTIYPGGSIQCPGYGQDRNCNGIEDAQDCQSPIIVDVKGDGFRLTGRAGGVSFDLDGDGLSTKIPWTAEDSDDAWLVLQ